MRVLNVTLSFVIAVLFFTSCKKSNTSPKSVSTTITAAYYFKGTLNGHALTWQAALDGSPGYYTGSSSNTSLYQGINTGGLTALLSAATGLTPQLGVEFRTFRADLSQDVPAYFNSFVNIGAWVYAASSSFTAGTKAIAIYYTDATGKQYSSIGAQAASSANVLAVTPVPAQLGIHESLKIKLTFSCTLYPTDGTGSNLSLTSAEATVMLEDLLH
jgi:hypothetical protein